MEQDTVANRIRERAHQIWIEAGKPEGKEQDYSERAREEIEQEAEKKIMQNRGADHHHLMQRTHQKAYEMWEREGKPDGKDKEHWKKASKEISGDQPESIVPAPPKDTAFGP